MYPVVNVKVSGITQIFKGHHVKKDWFVMPSEDRRWTEVVKIF